MSVDIIRVLEHIDGTTYNRVFMETMQSLCRRALHFDDRDGRAYARMYEVMQLPSWMCACKRDDSMHVCLLDGTRLSKHDVCTRVYMYYTHPDKLSPSAQNDTMYEYVKRNEPWSRMGCRRLWSGLEKEFAVLLLGLQRLEDTGVIQEAHKSMIEDMFTCFRWDDDVF
jgi:hypothetical protein